MFLQTLREFLQLLCDAATAGGKITASGIGMHDLARLLEFDAHAVERPRPFVDDEITNDEIDAICGAKIYTTDEVTL